MSKKSILVSFQETAKFYLSDQQQTEKILQKSDFYIKFWFVFKKNKEEWRPRAQGTLMLSEKILLYKKQTWKTFSEQ